MWIIYRKYFMMWNTFCQWKGYKLKMVRYYEVFVMVKNHTNLITLEKYFNLIKRIQYLFIRWVLSIKEFNLDLITVKGYSI